MDKRCYELIGAGHRKFWTVEVVGGTYLATFGRIGTAGQTQVKTFATEHQAYAKALDMIDDKQAKGYRLVEADKHPGAAPDLLESLGILKAMRANFA